MRSKGQPHNADTRQKQFYDDKNVSFFPEFPGKMSAVVVLRIAGS